MIRVLPKTLWLVVAFSTLLTNQISAYCSRCVKIESERAKEEAEHPQTFHYYDDQMGLHPKSESKAASDPSEVQEEDLSGSAYRSSKEGGKNSQNPSGTSDRTIDSSKNIPKNMNALFLAASYLTQDQTSLRDTVVHSVNSPKPTSPPDLPFKEEFFEEGDGMRTENSSIPLHENSNDLKKAYLKNESPLSTPSFKPTYSMLLTILKTKFLLETLDGSFTLLVPTNEALNKLPPGTLIELAKPEHQDELAALVSNHVIAKKILKHDFETHRNREIKAISGRNLTIHSENGKLTVDGAQILRIEPGGYDGVIYIIDKVLIPKSSY